MKFRIILSVVAVVLLFVLYAVTTDLSDSTPNHQPAATSSDDAAFKSLSIN